MEVTEKMLEPQPVVVVRDRATVLHMSSVLVEALAEAVGAAGERMSGPPFVRYLSMDGDEWEIAAGVPVSEAVEPAGRVEMDELPGGRAVSAWHVGPYDRMKTTYEALQGWLAANALREAGAPWEVYWSSAPQGDGTPLRTEIVMPVESA